MKRARSKSSRTGEVRVASLPDPAGEWAMIQRAMRVYARSRGLGSYVHNTALPDAPGGWSFYAQRPGERSARYVVSTPDLLGRYRS